MAEYYPLLAKAIGSLPNSTPDSRRVVYERARKALIGQLRTLHPPVPDEDIDRESIELDRAVERLESEIANGVNPAAPSSPKPPPSGEARPPQSPASEPRAPQKPAPKPAPNLPASKPAASEPSSPPSASPASDRSPDAPTAARVPARLPTSPERKPLPPRPQPPKPLVPRPARPAAAEKTLPPTEPTVATPGLTSDPVSTPVSGEGRGGALETQSPPVIDARAEDAAPPKPSRIEDPRPLKPPQRPIAPQPPGPSAPRRQLWIIPAVVVLVVAVIAVAAWKLRDRPESLARKPAESTQSDSGKIAERVGGQQAAPSDDETRESKPAATAQATPAGPAPTASPNPEVPVARRAALLIEAPDEPNKVKTIVGNVVWKLNNAPQDANAAVGLAVEADVDLPEDKMKAIVTFEKNSDASLPASHTIKIRFIVEPGSISGGVKQISVPQMRPEASPNGEPLAGVTVQIVPNSFLVGLSPGNAEAANTDLMRRLQWVDVPMLLDNGKIAKLTFEKGESGQRDLNEAFEAWQK